MTSPWQMLAGNLAVVALFVLGWGHARYWLRSVPGVVRSALFGLAMGLGAIASMLMAAEIDNGYFIDLRLSLLAIAAFCGGPLAALLTSALAMSWRVHMAGAGMIAGLLLMAGSIMLGLIWRLLFRRRDTSARQVLTLGLAVALMIGSVIFAVPAPSRLDSFVNYILPTGLLNLIGTIIGGLVVMQARRLAAERDLLLAAMNQAPDYTYVKDRHSRFAVVNRAVAAFNGFANPQDMIGKTDFDLTTPERAQTLFDLEQQIIATGEPQLEREENLPDNQGRMRWFTTAKVPLLNASGEMIGIAGVTRDITDDKQLRQDLIDSRNTLSYALTEMSDGLAMFDSEGRIEFCNEQYRACFPYTGELRRPGAHMRDILEAVIESGEQVSAPRQSPDGWIERIVENLHRESEEEVNLFDGRWLQVRTRPTTEGKTLVVVTDVTRIKQAEVELQSATDQLKHLVRTDSLTGLLNRRAFDNAMDAEITRSARAGTPMSLLLIDVDRFKAYNDEYGHPSGDECLKLVAKHLQKSLKRSADMAVRYGGEEFAAILPGTDEDGAYLVAEMFRKSLADARLPHKGTERGILTASVGVATYMPDNLHRSVGELIQTADEALYSAKAAGRDRVYGTRVRAKQSKYAD
ncbi:PAS domain S-box-containing protein/diguanylate cyclase (GGDEF) domain-containing protein [Devosia sp. YR412]|uniref:diguanylate cyclase n=1 Tax=Devosia sp. YR412 TaxID=1881030 RepID=UPI0008C43C4F|nr:diguanylate cyclase [Devosia sp. YR412]SEQ54664.1 PAS domain S-box-containing protein/diguanylate cyclase (GGDEF) domain-containing protein [Devosia sp. YR412]